MKNQILDPNAVIDIESQVDRLLRDIGYPGGKVNLVEVRDRLKLDLHYYSSADPTLAEEVLHRLRVAGKQVLARPTLLLEAARTMDLRALFLPDRKRILLDESIPDLKQRWAEAHEIAHSITPWHADYMLGDTQQTLSQSCQEIIEAEANLGAGRLLFPQKEFREIRLSEEPMLSNVRGIAKTFGNTITSTLWRYIEDSEELVFGTIGQNPTAAKAEEPIISYFIRSIPFALQFSNVGEEGLHKAIEGCCALRKRGPLGTTELVLSDVNSVEHQFALEAFSNGYQVLTLAVHLGIKSTQIVIPAAQIGRPNRTLGAGLIPASRT